MRLKRNQIPGGHKEGRASFPIQSQYKVSKIHTLNPTLEKRRGGREEGREGHQEKEGRLGSYRRVRIEALAEPPNAVWEYTYRDPDGKPMHGMRRVLTADGHTYVIEWRTPRAVWATELQRLAVVLDSFGPAPGA